MPIACYDGLGRCRRRPSEKYAQEICLRWMFKRLKGNRCFCFFDCKGCESREVGVEQDRDRSRIEVRLRKVAASPRKEEPRHRQNASAIGIAEKGSRQN